MLLFALCWPSLPAQGEDDKEQESEAAQAVRRYARERLLQGARDTVDPARRAAGGLDELKRSLGEKRDRIQPLDPEGWAELETLLGPIVAQGESSDGLIQQGAIFYRWMAGLGSELPALYFSDARGRGIDLVDDQGKTTRVARLAADFKPMPRDVLILWKLDVQRQKDYGDLQVALAGIDDLRTVQPPNAVIALTRADELTFRYCRGYVDNRARQVTPRVDEFRKDVPSQGLVSAGSVRTREQRAVEARAKVNRVLAQMRGVEADLDRLAKEERRLKRASGTRGFEIEEAKRAFKAHQAELAAAEAARKAEEEKKAKAAAEAKKAAEPGDEETGEAGADDPKDAEAEGDASDEAADARTEEAVDEAPMHPTEAKLERLRLREILDAQLLRLLYITVRRADLRGQLLAEVLTQVKEEAVAAEDAFQRYEIELATVRRERQMDRLAFEQSSLQLAHERAQKQATEGAEAERPIWAAYDQALEALKVVNEATAAGVGMRRGLEARTKPVDCLEVPDAEGCLPGEEPPVEGAPAPAHLKRFRDPRSASLDASYVQDAMGLLDHPDWNARMTAEHYEAVDDRITALESALAMMSQADALQVRFDAAREGAESALKEAEKLSADAKDWWTWRERLREARAEWLDQNVAAFNETMRGVKEEVDKVAEDLETYRAFRSALLDLGTRSFRVRLERKLDPELLAEAGQEATTTLRSATRWISFQGDDHLGHFIVRNWQMLLFCLAVALGSIFLVRFLRHGVDRGLRRMATAVRELRAEPVTVRAEEAQAKRESAQSEAAARAEEAAALREVSKEEAGKAQRMGEGGYDGGEA